MIGERPDWAQCMRCRHFHRRDEPCAVENLFEMRTRDDVPARRAEQAEASTTYDPDRAAIRAAGNRLDRALSALGAAPGGRCRCPRWTPGGCCLDTHPMERAP